MCSGQAAPAGALPAHLARKRRKLLPCKTLLLKEGGLHLSPRKEAALQVDKRLQQRVHADMAAISWCLTSISKVCATACHGL